MFDGWMLDAASLGDARNLAAVRVNAWPFSGQPWWGEEGSLDVNWIPPCARHPEHSFPAWEDGGSYRQ